MIYIYIGIGIVFIAALILILLKNEKDEIDSILVKIDESEYNIDILLDNLLFDILKIISQYYNKDFYLLLIIWYNNK